MLLIVTVLMRSLLQLVFVLVGLMFHTCWANLNQIWISLGPIKLIHKEVHPCLSLSKNLLKVLISVASLVSCFRLFHLLMTRSEKKCFLKSVLHQFFLIFAVWPLVRLFESSWKKVSNGTAV